MTFTPGPWRIEKSKSSLFQYQIMAYDGLTIAYVAPANRHLIMAAPDLLAACESVVRDADKGYGPDTARVRAAIAKAGAGAS